MNDYGKRVGNAFNAIYRLHLDTGKLLQDCDGSIGKGLTSLFGNVVTRDLSKAIYDPGFWMPGGVYRFYDASKSGQGLVEGVTIYYWDAPPLHDEPLFILAQMKYRVGDGDSAEPPDCREWDIWESYFTWNTDHQCGKVIRLNDVGDGRLEWVKVISAPLYSIKSIKDVEQMMSKVRQENA